MERAGRDVERKSERGERERERGRERGREVGGKESEQLEDLIAIIQHTHSTGFSKEVMVLKYYHIS